MIRELVRRGILLTVFSNKDDPDVAMVIHHYFPDKPFALLRGRMEGVPIKPAPDGTGLIVGGGMRPVLEAAGIRDAVGKSLGSKNRLNVVKATLDALYQLRSAEEIAGIRA